MILAIARVNDEAEGKGYIIASSKKRYFLRDRIFEDFEVVAVEIIDECALPVADGKSHVYQLHVDLDRVLTNRKTGKEQQS
jgi:hypothetical protein